MNKYLTKGTIAGVLTLASAVALAFGKTQLSAYFSDPATVTTILTVATGAIGLVAGVLKGIEAKPVAPPQA